jgi:hypothetical protein
MQLGGSLKLMLIVPIPGPVVMVLEEFPPQLTMMPVIARTANEASKSALARGLRAIHKDSMLLLL